MQLQSIGGGNTIRSAIILPGKVSAHHFICDVVGVYNASTNSAILTQKTPEHNCWLIK